MKEVMKGSGVQQSITCCPSRPGPWPDGGYQGVVLCHWCDRVQHELMLEAVLEKQI